MNDKSQFRVFVGVNALVYAALFGYMCWDICDMRTREDSFREAQFELFLLNVEIGFDREQHKPNDEGG